MIRGARVITAGLLAAVLLAPAGCASNPHKGYVFGSTYDSSVRTIAVPVFDNASYTPGLEQTLTEAIVKRIQSSTPWRIAGRASADTVLTGTIEDVRYEQLTRTRGTGFVQEQMLTLSATFTWRDNRTGEARVRREHFTATTTFMPSRGLIGEPGERVEIGQRTAVDELARAIVAELRSDF